MKRHRECKTMYYQSHEDDFVESKNQSMRLPADYVWIHNSLSYRIASQCLYWVVSSVAALYCRFGLHVAFENRAVLRQCRRSGCFLYANHTQPIGDALIPIRALSSKRCYIVAAPANLGIPVLGRLLPMLGALPIPDSVAGKRELHKAIRRRIHERRSVVIYPEAHVWPWYTGIRPYPATAFCYPVDCKAPAFCITTTYRERSPGKKPRLVIYADGPFYPDPALSKKGQKEKLRNEIYACMERRSQSNTCEYIRYRKREK